MKVLFLMLVAALSVHLIATAIGLAMALESLVLLRELRNDRLPSPPTEVRRYRTECIFPPDPVDSALVDELERDI